MSEQFEVQPADWQWAWVLRAVVQQAPGEGHFRRASACTLVAQLLTSLPELPGYRGMSITGLDPVDDTDVVEIVVLTDTTDLQPLLQDLIDTTGLVGFRGGISTVTLRWHQVTPNPSLN